MIKTKTKKLSLLYGINHAARLKFENGLSVAKNNFLTSIQKKKLKHLNKHSNKEDIDTNDNALFHHESDNGKTKLHII